jgi:hypothetical protein
MTHILVIMALAGYAANHTGVHGANDWKVISEFRGEKSCEDVAKKMNVGIFRCLKK